MFIYMINRSIYGDDREKDVVNPIKETTLYQERHITCINNESATPS